MYNLGDQWPELGTDGKMHMYKAVEGPCERCDIDHTCNLSANCPMAYRLVAKDLGILNADGCLPEAITGFYPILSKHFIEGKFRWMLYAFTVDGMISTTVWGDTLQEAKDAWNRRT